MAADARLRAKQASTAVVQRAENVRSAAQDRAQAVRERAEKAKQRAVAAKDSVVRLKNNMQQRIAESSRKASTSGGTARKLSSATGNLSPGLVDALRPRQQPSTRLVHSRLL